MYNLITAKAESSNTNSNSIKEHLLKNCENDQINRMLDLCDPNQRLALQKNIIGLRYGQPSSIELPHFDDILTSFKVERPQPHLLTRWVRRPGSEEILCLNIYSDES